MYQLVQQYVRDFFAISDVENSLETLKLVMDGSIEEIVFSFLVVFVH